MYIFEINLLEKLKKMRKNDWENDRNISPVIGSVQFKTSLTCDLKHDCCYF